MKHVHVFASAAETGLVTRWRTPSALLGVKVPTIARRHPTHATGCAPVPRRRAGCAPHGCSAPH